jgi:pyruvate-formate lyase-activating enzyme
VLGGGQRGDVVFCCQSWVTTSIGNIVETSVAEVWNGQAARDFRRSILDGTFEYCKSDICPHLQRVDGPVQRVSDVRDDRLLDIIRRETTVLPFGPTDLICCFDQSCNLSCPSCRAQLTMETRSAAAIVRIQERLEREALQDARFLYITGSGDPFGSPFFRRWLQTMKPSDSLERIHLHTNGLLWTQRAWESIPERTRALVRSATISIDAATPETYAVNRRGGDFATLLERLAFIADLRRNGPLQSLEIHMTVQVNNYREMPAFVALGHRHDCDSVGFHQLLDWGAYAPDEYVARAVQFPGHPEHRAFLEVLSDTRLEDPVVYLSNLSDLRRQAAQDKRPFQAHAPV